MIMDIFELSEKYGNEKLQIGDYDGLFHDLHGAIGKKIKTSLVVGKPDATEEDRILEKVSFIDTVHGISVLLEMKNNKNEKISLIIPNVIKAYYDNSFPFHINNMVKYHFDCYNNLLDSAFIETNISKRNEEYFAEFKKELKLSEHSIVTGRIFIHTN